MPSLIIDFSDIEEPAEDEDLPSEEPVEGTLESMKRSVGEEVGRQDPLEKDRSALSPRMPPQARYSPQFLNAMKATFTATGGNIAETSRRYGMEPYMVKRLALEDDWPVYGEDVGKLTKGTKSHLEQVAGLLWKQLSELLASLNVEVKGPADLNEKGKSSYYVASLSQRSGTFKDLFDRWMHVMSLLEPETYAPMTGKHTGSQNTHPEAHGDIEGIDRQISAFFAGVAVGVVDRTQRGDSSQQQEEEHEEQEVIEVEASS